MFGLIVLILSWRLAPVENAGDQTGPESPLIADARTPPLTFSELPGRFLVDVSADGTLLLVESQSSGGTSLEVIETRSSGVIDRYAGPPVHTIRAEFVRGPGPTNAATVRVEEKGGPVRFTLWKFHTHQRIQCGTSSEPDLKEAPSTKWMVTSLMVAFTVVSGDKCSVEYRGSDLFPSSTSSSPDGLRYLTGSLNSGTGVDRIALRNAETGLSTGEIDSGDQVFELGINGSPHFTADGKQIAIIAADDSERPRWLLRLYDSRTLGFQKQFDVTFLNPRSSRAVAHEDSLTVPPYFRPTIAVAPGGRIAAVGNVHHSVRIFDLETQIELAHAPLARPPYFFTPDGAALITNGGAGIRIWNPAAAIGPRSN